jgi:hypothetical protein
MPWIRRGNALCFCLTKYLCRHFAERSEAAESVILVVNVVGPIKRLKILSNKCNLASSFDRAEVVGDSEDVGGVVIPHFMLFFRILLSVKRHGYWHCPSND